MIGDISVTIVKGNSHGSFRQATCLQSLGQLP
jgi:hypothetical protein